MKTPGTSVCNVYVVIYFFVLLLLWCSVLLSCSTRGCFFFLGLISCSFFLFFCLLLLSCSSVFFFFLVLLCFFFFLVFLCFFFLVLRGVVSSFLDFVWGVTYCSIKGLVSRVFARCFYKIFFKHTSIENKEVNTTYEALLL